MNCAVDTKKLMFEIYRDHMLNGDYRVVYFTELGEHDKEEEIGNALRGEHFFDGFILHRKRQEAKETIENLLCRLNTGELLDRLAVERELAPFLA